VREDLLHHPQLVDHRDRASPTPRAMARSLTARFFAFHRAAARRRPLPKHWSRPFLKWPCRHQPQQRQQRGRFGAPQGRHGIDVFQITSKGLATKGRSPGCLWSGESVCRAARL
jgi:hypothetical protein